MTDPVPGAFIETIVGTHRHPTLHQGRAASRTGTIYVLHSQRCLDTYDDLGDCPYSHAVDEGIDAVADLWAELEDRPLVLAIVDGYLVPEVRRDAQR